MHLQVHVFDHEYAADFYGENLNVLICGFLRYAIQGSGLQWLLWTWRVFPVCLVLTARHSGGGCTPLRLQICEGS